MNIKNISEIEKGSRFSIPGFVALLGFFGLIYSFFSKDPMIRVLAYGFSFIGGIYARKNH